MVAGILASMTGSVNVLAAEAIVDPDQIGSIQVTIKTKGEPVTEGSLLLYQAAELTEEDGEYKYEAAAEFTDSIFSQKEMESADVALQLERFVVDRKLPGRSMPLNQKGIAKAKGLVPGVYLIIQGESAKDVEPILPFLVSVPMKEDGEYIYDVDASPKVELGKPDNPNDPPNTPPNTPPKTPPSRLPQTGQLWWPVPILFILGFWLVMIGLIRRRNDRD